MKAIKKLKLSHRGWFQMEPSGEVKFPVAITMGHESAVFSAREAQRMRTFLTRVIRATPKKKKSK